MLNAKSQVVDAILGWYLLNYFGSVDMNSTLYIMLLLVLELFKKEWIWMKWGWNK